MNLLVGRFKVPAKEFDHIKYKYQLLLTSIIGNMVRVQNAEIAIDYIAKKEEKFEVILPLNPTIKEVMEGGIEIPHQIREGCFDFTKV